MKLENGSKVGVIGGGPSGSMTAFFLLALSKRIGIKFDVDIYEPKAFPESGPKNCNYCAGVISEQLVQTLAAEGIDIPPEVVQTGIDNYTIHIEGKPSTEILTPIDELRIATVYRGFGPQNEKEDKKIPRRSFDGYLLELAESNGACIISKKVDGLHYSNARKPCLVVGGDVREYDFIVGAIGLNTNSNNLFERIGLISEGSQKTTRTIIHEVYVGENTSLGLFGTSIHNFILNIPGLHFASITPKISYVTVSMLVADNYDRTKIIEGFYSHPQVKELFQYDIAERDHVTGNRSNISCFCNPRLYKSGPEINFNIDRIVVVAGLRQG